MNQHSESIRFPSWFIRAVMAAIVFAAPWSAWVTKALVEISVRQEAQISILEEQAKLADRVRVVEKDTTVNAGRIQTLEAAVQGVREDRKKTMPLN